MKEIMNFVDKIAKTGVIERSSITPRAQMRVARKLASTNETFSSLEQRGCGLSCTPLQGAVNGVRNLVDAHGAKEGATLAALRHTRVYSPCGSEKRVPRSVNHAPHCGAGRVFGNRRFFIRTRNYSRLKTRTRQFDFS